MSLSKEVVIDQIEIKENGIIQIRQAIRVIEDGSILSQTYHRHCLSPGDSLEKEDTKVFAIAKAVWTDEVVKAHKDMLEARKMQK